MNDLRRCNLIIGPNNCGKSNLRKFFHWMATTVKKRSASEYWYHLYNQDPNLTPADRWQARETNVDAHLVFSSTPSALASALDKPELQTEAFHVRAFTHRPPFGERLALEIGSGPFVPIFSNPSAESTELKYDSEQTSLHPALAPLIEDQLENGKSHSSVTFPLLTEAISEMCSEIGGLFLCIGPQRNPRSDATPFADLAPHKLRETLKEIVDRDPYGWQEIQQWLEGQVSALMNVSETRIDIVKSDDIRFTFVHTDGTRSPPMTQDNVGTGIVECFLLLAYLKLHPRRDTIIVVDELEAHLHPGAAQRLVTTILSEFPHTQLFLLTHSTSLVDAATGDWRIFRLCTDGLGRSVATSLADKDDELELLEELGLRPSQLFMARTVIWAEGPSDVIYLRAILREHAPDLLEHRDFSFVCYGGSNLRHVSYGDSGKDALVRILSVCTRAVVVHDEDGRAEDTLKPAVKRLRDAAMSAPHCETVQTEGYEMESMICPQVLTRCLEDLTGESFDPCKVDPRRSLIGNALTSLKALDEKTRDKVSRKVSRSKVPLAKKIVESTTGSILSDSAGPFIAKLILFLQAQDAAP